MRIFQQAKERENRFAQFHVRSSITNLNFVKQRKRYYRQCGPTIFARNYGTAAVISYNLKGIAPPVPPVQCWIDKNLMSGCEAPTLKRVGGGRGGEMYQ